MKKISPSASTCARNVARKLRLTTKRGRLIALFVTACVTAAVTITAASSAASFKKLLPAAQSGNDTSAAATDDRGEARQAGQRTNAGARDLAAVTRSASEDAPSLTTDKE